MNYELRMSDSGICELRRWTRFVRNWVKDILHFPTWCSSDWIHLNAGLGFQDFSKSIVIHRLRASEKMAMSEDELVRVVGARLAEKNKILWNRAGLEGIELAAAMESCEVKREENLGRNTNGSALKLRLNGGPSRRIWREGRCFADGRHYKPDIVVGDDSVITVIDMTYPYEKCDKNKCSINSVGFFKWLFVCTTEPSLHPIPQILETF